MKILLIDHVLESDKAFNDPIREGLSAIPGVEHETLKPVEIISAATLQRYGAIVIGGVPADVEKYPFALAEDDLTPIKEADIPVLGICLGHELICQSFGAEIKKDAEPEHGVISVTLTREGRHDDLFTGMPDSVNVVTMHRGSTDVPEGLMLLATSDTCTNQAVTDSSGLLRGVQFHPELSGDVGDIIFYNLARLAANHKQLRNAA